jgi:hypothetical protein
MRNNAAKYRVEATLTGSRDSFLGNSITIFEGHADLLTAEQVKALSIPITPQWESTMMNLTELVECFNVTKLVPEKSPPPVLSTATDADGKQVAIATRRVRKINVER